MTVARTARLFLVCLVALLASAASLAGRTASAAVVVPLNVGLSGSGIVASNPAGINCSSTCVAGFVQGTQVSLTAVPAPGWNFAGWGGACSGSGACSVTMSAAQSATASFSPATVSLSLSLSGWVPGTYVINTLGLPNGVYCPSPSCAVNVAYGSSVSLTASPLQGWAFAGWGGACAGFGICTVTMNGAQSVTATFTRSSVPVSVAVAGNGTVASYPPGINCGPICAANFSPQGLDLTATPAPGWRFVGWGGNGGCSGSPDPRCQVGISTTQPQNVTATFAPLPIWPLSVAVTGSGTVSSADGTINCGSACAANFLSGTPVNLAASAAPGWGFAGWSGACSGVGGCSLAVNAAQNVTATFTPIPMPLSVDVTGNGAVTSSPAGVNCTATCVGYFPSVSSATLTATPAAGWSFIGWGGACSSMGICTVPMSAAQNVTAGFVQNVAFNVALNGSGRVLSSPAGIDCGAACSLSLPPYAAGVLLAAAPANGFVFSRWSGACDSVAGYCSPGTYAPRNVTASFVPGFPLVIVANPGGVVTIPAGGNTCAGTCVLNFRSGSPVTLSAVPAAGSRFAGWGGACYGVSGDCTVTMNAAQNVMASFFTP